MDIIVPIIKTRKQTLSKVAMAPLITQIRVTPMHKIFEEYGSRSTI